MIATKYEGEGPARFLSTRVKNALKNDEIPLTREAIAAKSRDELLRVPNLGKVGVREIYDKLGIKEEPKHTVPARLRSLAGALIALAAEIERDMK